MIIDPKNNVKLVNKEVIVLLILIPIVSTSLVTRDKTSPVSWESKYLSGSLLIFIDIFVLTSLAK